MQIAVRGAVSTVCSWLDRDSQPLSIDNVRGESSEIWNSGDLEQGAIEPGFDSERLSVRRFSRERFESTLLVCLGTVSPRA